MKIKPKVSITKNGPYLVSGGLPLEKKITVPDEDGNSAKWETGNKFPAQENYALCRCGHSKNKPYCDGSHVKADFDGTETAGREDFFDAAREINGQDIALDDVPEFCSSARFCHGQAGNTWELTEASDLPAAEKEAVRQACHCPSGRLVMIDKKTGQPIEPEFKESIGLIEDPAAGVSGPIWLKGRVELEGADGEKYESRNRMTLCRCGKSENKPFCDGSHINCKFNDGDESLK
jgi:CDGSH-type Zn-finger protein